LYKLLHSPETQTDVVLSSFQATQLRGVTVVNCGLSENQSIQEKFM